MSDASKSSFVTALIDQAVVSGGSLIISIIAARQLGPSGFGAYVLATGLYLFLAGFQNAFVIGPLAVFGAGNDVNVPRYIWVTAKSQRLFAIGIAGVCILVSGVVHIAGGSRDLSLAFLGAGFSGFVSLSSDFWRQVLISRRLLREALLCDVINRMVALILLVGAIILMERLTLITIYGCLSISASLGIITASRLARNLVEKCDEFERRAYEAKNWAFGKWTAADYAITIGTGQLGPYLLASVVGTASAGVFGAVNQLTGIFHVFLNGVANYAYPLVVKEYYENGRKGVYRFTGKLIRYLSSGATFIVVPALIFAPTIIGLIYSASYENSGVAPFRIICFIGFFLAVSRPLDMALRVMEQVKIRSAISFAEFVFVLLVMYPAIRIGGVAGAAAAFLMGRCLVAICLVYAVFTIKELKWNRVWQSVGK